MFIRLGGCPLRCTYCDTPRSWKGRAQAELHLPAATEELANPLSATQLDGALKRLVDAHQSQFSGLVLAITGGEPLEQVDFLADWLPGAPAPALLETAGIYPARLARLLPMLRFVSLDRKDPADLRQGAELDAFADCLRATTREAAARSAAAPLGFWTKFVIQAETDPAWLDAQLQEVAELAPGSQVYLQPVTPRPGSPAPAAADTLLAHVVRNQALALDLRVLPQVHPFLEIR